jgi:BirA family biotin operon repressor/biotin-[acetyl-CoA-carboxylase] ligase
MSMAVSEQLLGRLADGRFHSGEQLAQLLGVTRSAVWKQIQRLEAELGLDISAVRGRGYRLSSPLELLDAGRIRAELNHAARECLEQLTLQAITPSTNACAAADPPTEIGCARAWLAEHQTDGRGRRGRQWVSSFGENLYLSIAWRFELPMTELGGLSLVAGVVLAEVLAQLGLEGHSLKWPNDVLVDGRKLCGVLLEVSGEADGPSTAVLGVGVNFRLPARQGSKIDQPWTDLSRSNAPLISRNRLAGVLLDRLIEACREFGVGHLAPFLPRWDRFDRFKGQMVRVVRGPNSSEGIYRGITPGGAMLLEGPSGLGEYHAGEVSLRKGGVE